MIASLSIEQNLSNQSKTYNEGSFMSRFLYTPAILSMFCLHDRTNTFN